LIQIILLKLVVAQLKLLLTLLDKFSKILHPSVLTIHMVWAKWCLCKDWNEWYVDDSLY